MALLRKIDPSWRPSENDDLKVGETIEISDYRRLVELGTAECMDDEGNVLPLPGTVFVCGICYEKIDNHQEYVKHIIKAHGTYNPKISVTEEPTEEPEEKETKET